MQAMATLHQALHQGGKREFDAATPAAAELSDGCAHQHQIQCAIGHALRSPGRVIEAESHGSQRRCR